LYIISTGNSLFTLQATVQEWHPMHRLVSIIIANRAMSLTLSQKTFFIADKNG
jgi:hypothetical protein